MRKDLGMRKGKMIAQGAHASMKVFFDMMEKTDSDKYELDFGFEGGKQAQEWFEGIFTKICVSVDSEEELLKVFKYACDVDLPCAIILDNGKTEFGGVPTHTCCAIGPANSEDIDKITGDLKLL